MIIPNRNSSRLKKAPFMEKIIEIQIPKMLLASENQNNARLRRLETILNSRSGILRAHLQPEKDPIDICIHYDPQLLDQQDVQRLAEDSGNQINRRWQHVDLVVEGMDCSDCAFVLEHSLGHIPGIYSVSASYALEKLWVDYDGEQVNLPSIERRIRSLGYQIPRSPFERNLLENRALILSLSGGLLALIGWLGGLFFGFQPAVSTFFYLAAFLFSGFDPAWHAWHALRSRHFDTDLLMVLAAIGAAVIGHFGEGALLLFLFSLGHALEERLLGRARKAIAALGQIAPRQALTRQDGREITVPVEKLAIGQVVIIRPDERIPVDGLVTLGASAVDQAAITGESLPVDKAPGDRVFAGTLNGAGALEVQVSRLAKDSTLRRVMQLVEEAQAQKSPAQQSVERFERILVPVVLLSTLAVIFIPPLFGMPWREAFLRAMTLLVAASPCALALGAPAAVLAGIAQAARGGVLIKGGAYLEALGGLQAIAFDKTGTLTIGQPEVRQVVASGLDETELVSLAAGIARRSNHPLAGAILRYASQEGIEPLEMEAVESLSGFGLSAQREGEGFLLGSLALLKENGLQPEADLQNRAARLEEQGGSLVWLARAGTVSGLLALADTLRPEAPAVLRQLKALGIRRTVMLTGDNPRAAAEIARQLGLDEVRAGLLPAEKLEQVRQLVKDFRQAAMVGDGVNDAPSLANASVGIALGGAGSDVALQAADVALMGADLTRLPFAVGLGRQSRRIITQNLAIASTVIVLLAGASLVGLVPIGLAVLLHEGSTVVVVLNALRLLAYRLE